MADERKVEELNQEAESGCDAPEGEEALTEAPETEAAEAPCEADSREDAGKEPQEDGETAEDGNDAGKEKKGFFSKKKDKKEEAYKEQIAELQDKVMRQMAEFENFRKRTEKEKSAMFETGAKSVIEKILPVVDNFERGLAMVPEEKKDEPFVEGMTKIYRQLLTELENLGVTPIEAVGQEFDPELHNAVMQVENEELESGTVAQELQKGYKYRDSVVRHSMVAVVQ
ncbi:MAG TPA: nucleotide exchange factor GrpE [Candidatus Eisenbergiella pullicola]|nr:nucleotide exchange factor GrpE [Candidatus Eisenbergiella pullicola]